ncbi:hypothetical protein N431DRAFT_536384 [Stipitochalara longipes BDJ]|nr:hypothetical protein N431DRAFT_536384 [Stipitochalara longipes BDJ]
MYSSPTGVSSTLPGTGTHSPSSPTVTSYWWGTRPFLELAFAGDFNPYISDLDFIGVFTGTPLNSAQSALQQNCGNRWSSSFYQWMSTAVENGTLMDQFSCYKTATSPMQDPIMACEDDVKENGLLSTVLAELSRFPFTASTPCCGQCTFTAGDVQVYHWPAATTTPSISLLVNTEGFTFTYPSVYVAFNTFIATDMCGVVGSDITSVTTMAFDMTDLSTAISYFSSPLTTESIGFNRIQLPTGILTSQSWWTYTPVDWQTSITCTNIVTTLWSLRGFDEVETASITRAYTELDTWQWGTSCTTFSQAYTSVYIPWPVTYNPCTPYLSVPTQLLAIDKRWNTCVRNFRGLHDPPSALDTASGFFLVRTADLGSNPPTKPDSASAGPTIQQPAATKTPAPETKPTNSQGDDPLLAAHSQSISKLPASITLGQNTYTANSVGEFVINAQTLTPGGKITNANNVLSMATDGHALIIDSSTMFLEPSYAIGTQTLVPGGPAITVGNTVMSLAPGSGAGEESLVIGVSVTEGVGGPAAVTVGGSVISVGPGSGTGGGGKSIVTEVSVTVDVSMLSATNLPGEEPTASVTGEGNGAGAAGIGKSSGSEKINVGCWVAWQILLSVAINIGRFL